MVIFSRSSLNANISFHRYTENTFAHIKFNFNTCSYFITAAYRLPSTNVTKFLDELRIQLKAYKDNETFYLITGDINIDILDIRNKHVSQYLNLMAANGFLSYINKPTRVTHGTSSCIDHFFVKNNLNMTDTVIIPKIIQTDITDHYAITLSVLFPKTTCIGNNDLINLVKLKYDKLSDVIDKEGWEKVYTIQEADMAYNYFINRLLSFIELSSYNLIIKSKQRKLKPWIITMGLITSIRKRDKLKLESKKIADNALLLDKYRCYRNKLDGLIKETKRTYYANKLNRDRNNLKKVWETINEGLNVASHMCLKIFETFFASGALADIRLQTPHLG